MSLDQPTHSLQPAIDQFLLDLKNANKSAQTIRVYRTDLGALARACLMPISDITIDQLRDFFTQHTHLQPATRARKQAAVASFLGWAYRHDLIDHNPMLKIDRVQVAYAIKRPPSRHQVETILITIPSHNLRDRLLFRLLFETGLRISEALSLHVEDIDLTQDDERVTVIGKGQRRRTILLDDTELIVLIKRYLRQMGYLHGPFFRAQKNYRGGALRYQSAQELWAKYCQEAGVKCTLHQLRHAHATELVNDGVSLATIRKRLGHQNLQSTLRYAQQSDEAADAELRAWRRRKQLHHS